MASTSSRLKCVLRGCIVFVVASLLPVAAASQKLEAEAIFDDVWTKTRDNLCDPELSSRHFTERNYARLKESLRATTDIASLADTVNRFLGGLGVSHTRLVTADDLEFYLYGATWSPRELDTLEVSHIGIQWVRHAGEYVVTGTLEGYPAERAGLVRGDVILTAGGQPFRPLRSFRDGSRCSLVVRRGSHTFETEVGPVYESPHRSVLSAMCNSMRTVDRGGLRVGYIHVWSLLSPLIREEFARLVRDSLATTQGLVLDLRGGIGGAWAEFLDPFFPDRRGYPVVTVTNRSGPVRMPRPDSLAPHACYSGPMVVIVDEGTRSGKEVLAFQFKKSKRARLVGTTTAGAVRGAAFFAKPAEGYILAVALTALRLDGEDLEGRGVTPDVRVERPLERPAKGDPQLERALEEIDRLCADLGARPAPGKGRGSQR